MISNYFRENVQVDTAWIHEPKQKSQKYQVKCWSHVQPNTVHIGWRTVSVVQGLNERIPLRSLPPMCAE